MSDVEEKEERRTFGLSVGDVGVLAIALLFALGSVYLMIGPSPFAGFFSKHPKPASAHEEVTIGITPETNPPAPNGPKG